MLFAGFKEELNIIVTNDKLSDFELIANVASAKQQSLGLFADRIADLYNFIDFS